MFRRPLSQSTIPHSEPLDSEPQTQRLSETGTAAELKPDHQPPSFRGIRAKVARFANNRDFCKSCAARDMEVPGFLSSSSSNERVQCGERKVVQTAQGRFAPDSFNLIVMLLLFTVISTISDTLPNIFRLWLNGTYTYIRVDISSYVCTVQLLTYVSIK